MIEAPSHPTFPHSKGKRTKTKKKSLGGKGINLRQWAVNNVSNFFGQFENHLGSLQNQVNLES
jgi:hypothetical protein